MTPTAGDRGLETPRNYFGAGGRTGKAWQGQREDASAGTELWAEPKAPLMCLQNISPGDWDCSLSSQNLHPPTPLNSMEEGQRLSGSANACHWPVKCLGGLWARWCFLCTLATDIFNRVATRNGFNDISYSLKVQFVGIVTFMGKSIAFWKCF